MKFSKTRSLVIFNDLGVLGLNTVVRFAGTWYRVTRTAWQIPTSKCTCCLTVQVKQKERLKLQKTVWILCLMRR